VTGAALASTAAGFLDASRMAVATVGVALRGPVAGVDDGARAAETRP